MIKALAYLLVVLIGAASGWLVGQANAPTPASNVGDDTTTAPEFEATELKAPPPTGRSDSKSGSVAGDGMMNGSVVDENDAPIIGAPVVVEPALEWYDRGDADETTRRHARRLASRFETTTDMDGRFTILGVSTDVEYIVAATVPWAHAPEVRRTKSGTAVAFAPRQPWSPMTPFVASRKLPVHVTLLDRAVDHASVTVRRWGADNDPKLFVPSQVDSRRNSGRGTTERHSVTLWGEDGATVHASAHGVYAAEAIEVSPDHDGVIPVALLPATSVHGRVIGVTRSTELSLRSSDSKSEARQSVRHERGSGAFSCVGLEPGDYVFELTDRNSGQSAEFPLTVVAGFQTIEVSLPQQVLPYTSLLKIVDASGGAVDGVTTAILSSQVGTHGASKPAYLTPVGPGTYEFSLHSVGGDLDAGTVDELRLRINTDLGEKEINIPVDQWEGPHTIVLPGRSSLQIDTPGYAGSGYEGRLRIFVPGARDRFLSSFQRPELDAFGRVKAEGLFPGAQLVWADVKVDLFDHAVTYYREWIELEPGYNTLSLPLPTSHRVVLRVRDELHGETLWLQTPTSQRLLQATAAGEHVWKVPSGPYKITIGSERMQFRVTGDMALEFQQTSFRFARVRSVRSGGQLASLGVEEGDLVVRIDGRGFYEADVGSLARRLLEENAQVRLTLERGGDTFDVIVRDADMGNESLQLRNVLDAQTP